MYKMTSDISQPCDVVCPFVVACQSPNTIPFCMLICALGKSSTLTEEVRKYMATMAHSTLVALTERLTTKYLPKHWFVYGLHLSPSWLNIFVHFPKFDHSSKTWTFCQVHLAEHWLSVPHSMHTEYSNSDFDIFQERWRLAIAVMTILKQVQTLERDLSNSQPATNNPDDLPCPGKLSEMRYGICATHHITGL